MCRQVTFYRAPLPGTRLSGPTNSYPFLRRATMEGYIFLEVIGKRDAYLSVISSKSNRTID